MIGFDYTKKLDIIMQPKDYGIRTTYIPTIAQRKLWDEAEARMKEA